MKLWLKILIGVIVVIGVILGIFFVSSVILMNNTMDEARIGAAKDSVYNYIGKVESEIILEEIAGEIDMEGEGTFNGSVFKVGTTTYPLKIDTHNAPSCVDLELKDGVVKFGTVYMDNYAFRIEFGTIIQKVYSIKDKKAYTCKQS